MRKSSRCQLLSVRTVLLEEVEQILLGQAQLALALAHVLLGGVVGVRGRPAAGHGPPQVPIVLFLALDPLAPAPLVFGEIQLRRAGIAKDALTHQRMRRVDGPFDRLYAVSLLADGDVALGEVEIVQNAGRVRPLLEQIVVLEEVVVTEGGVGDHERLHRHRVLLHAIADAWVGVDDDLVGERGIALAVERLVAREALAVRPVGIHQRHADRRIGVEHLLGRDDLDLVGEDVEAELLAGDFVDRVVDPVDGLEVPLGAVEQETARGARLQRRFCGRGHYAAPLVCCLAKSLRKTG